MTVAVVRVWPLGRSPTGSARRRLVIRHRAIGGCLLLQQCQLHSFLTLITEVNTLATPASNQRQTRISPTSDTMPETCRRKGGQEWKLPKTPRLRGVTWRPGSVMPRNGPWRSGRTISCHRAIGNYHPDRLAQNGIEMNGDE